MKNIVVLLTALLTLGIWSVFWIVWAVDNEQPSPIILALLLVIAVLLSVAYLLPAYIAAYRNTEHQSAILVANIIFGFTAIGWGIALVAAFADKEKIQLNPNLSQNSN
ncbi:MAG: superinfection immunity protein, partial [Fervidobacterium sp.]